LAEIPLQEKLARRTRRRAMRAARRVHPAESDHDVRFCVTKSPQIDLIIGRLRMRRLERPYPPLARRNHGIARDAG
jgi:hypothetical protein